MATKEYEFPYGEDSIRMYNWLKGRQGGNFLTVEVETRRRRRGRQDGRDTDAGNQGFLI
jgi:hypothetical protein